MGNKISTYTAITTLANGDLLDISKDMGASTYATRKITYANLLTELNADLTFPDSNNLGNANLTADNAARTYTLAGTSTESLAFLNVSAAEILKLKGDRTILIGGYTTNGFVKTSAGTGLITVSTQVAATEGGTGISSYTTGDILYSSASNTLAKLAAGTNGHVLTLAAGVPSWAAAPNLGSANLTSADDARTFTLKSGGTASQNLQFLNSGGGNLLQLKGNNTIDFGSTANGISMDTYLSTSVFTKYKIGSSDYIVLDASLRRQYYYDSSATARVVIDSENGNFFLSKGSYIYVNSIGNTIMNLSAFSNNSYCQFSDSTGTTSLQLYGGSGTTIVSKYAAVIGKYAVSGGSSLEVFGPGSTSATTTALFQNSASVAALTIKDDLTSTFGGIVTAPQIITTPFTVSVAANAGTITIAYRENKFTNSSAAAMTITISTTGALDGDIVRVRIYDFSAAAQTITWVNTENSSVAVPATSNGSTTLPLTVGFQYNSATSKWRCIDSV